jgi:hypothetical protein
MNRSSHTIRIVCALSLPTLLACSVATDLEDGEGSLDTVEETLSVGNCTSLGGGRYSCPADVTPGPACTPTRLYRTVMNCAGGALGAEQSIDLSTGYGNYTCGSRYQQQCVDDGSFDAYYSERCDYTCPVATVGLIPSTLPAYTTCPGGLAMLRMDDEDSANNNQFTFNGQNKSGRNFSVGGLAHVSSPRRAGGNTQIHFCPAQTGALPVLSHDYAVLSLSSTCPSNSYRFTRRFDNEDTGNANKVSGPVGVTEIGISGGYAVLNFCFVPGKAGAPAWNQFLNNSLVFTNANLGVSGRFYTDDEDGSDNNNQWSTVAPEYASRMQALVSTGANTWISYGSGSTTATLDAGNLAGCNVTVGAGVECSTTLGDGGPLSTTCKPTAQTMDMLKSAYCWW